LTGPERLTTRAEREAFRSIKRVCYAGLDSVSLRAEVVRRASPIIPAEACGMMATDPATGLFTHGWTEGLPDWFVHQYRTAVYPDEASTFVDLARSGQTTSTHDSALFLTILMLCGTVGSLDADIRVEENRQDRQDGQGKERRPKSDAEIGQRQS
jgi:hypothetical protein